jgi:L-fuculose-phosphate aldolase
MSDIREELCAHGRKISARGLVAGAGGNISARDGDIIWMKPSGFAMEDMEPDDLSGVDIASGKVTRGKTRPTSEVNMHLGIYRNRPDVQAVFHTHSPWASGILASDGELKPMFAEFVCDLGAVVTVPYITPTTQALAEVVAEAAKTADTIFMRNHGVCALGKTLKQAYYRVWVVEDAAKSLVAAKIMGNPVFFNEQQLRDLAALDAPKHRVNMMEGERK